MRKVVILLSLFVEILGCSTFSKITPPPSERVNSEFPYALLTSDFGILKQEDLAINSCFAKPVPFSESSTSYFYWQCFEARQSNLFCEGGRDESEEEYINEFHGDPELWRGA